MYTSSAVFLAVLLAGFGLARLITELVSRRVRRSGFDATGLVAGTVYSVILLIALRLGLAVFGPTPVSDFFDSVVAWLPRLVLGLALAIVTAVLARLVQHQVANLLGGLEHGAMLSRFAAVFVWGAGLVAALGLIGVDTSITLPILVTVLVVIGAVLITGYGRDLVRSVRRTRSGAVARPITQAGKPIAPAV